MQVIRAGAYAEMPWKNGGGLSYEIAADHFWRVALAVIDRDGPFSDWRGFDRTILALDGGRVLLDAGEETIELVVGEPYAFAGETNIYARIEGGPARDLNVMTERGEYAHDLEVVSGKTRFVLDDDEFAFVYAIDATVQIGGEEIAAGDTMAIEEPQSFTVTTAGRAAVIRLTGL